MFGKPNWFRPKRIGWGLVPVTWQGWAYAVLWTFAIVLPFIVLVERQQGLEAIIWLAASIGLLAWDVREILRQLRKELRAERL